MRIHSENGSLEMEGKVEELNLISSTVILRKKLI